MVDDAQATAGINRFKASMTGLANPTNNLTQNMGKLNQTFNAGVTPIKNQGNALTNLNTNLNANVKQTRSSISALKDHVLGMGLAVSGAVSLFTSFNDLTGAQIRNERAQNAAASATNKVTDIQRALNKMQDAGKKGTADYNAKLADLKIAQDKAQTATERATFSQDKLADTQANFAANIMPQSILAITGFTDVLQGMGGEKGFAGLIPKIKNFGGSLKTMGGNLIGAGGGIKGMIGNLGALGLAVGGAIGLYEEFNAQMKIHQQVVSGSIKPIEGATKTLDQMSKLDFTSIEGAIISIAKLTGGSKALADILKPEVQRLKDVDSEIKKIPPTMNKAATSTDAWVNMMIRALQSSDPKKIIEFNKAFKESGQPVERYTQILNEATAAINDSKKAATTAAGPIKTLADNWKLQTEALQGGTVKNLNLTSGAYLDVNNAIAKTIPSIQANITKTKEQNEMQKQMAKTLANLSNSWRNQTSTMLGLGAPLDTIKAKFKAFNDAVKQIPTKDVLLFNEALKNWGGGKLTQTAEQSKQLSDSTKTTMAHIRDIVAKSALVGPALKKAAEEAAKFNEMMAASNKAFRGVFKIESNADKIFKDLVKGLPNKVEKKVKLQVKFGQNVEDANQSFNNFLLGATKVNDKTADIMANEVVQMIDKKFKGMKGPFAGLETALKTAIANPNTPETLKQLLLKFVWPTVDVPSTLTPPPPLPPPKDPVKVPSELTTPPPIPPPKEPVKVPSVLKTPPPIPPPKTPVKAPAVFTTPPPIPPPKTPVKVPAVLVFGGSSNIRTGSQAGAYGGPGPVKVPATPKKKWTGNQWEWNITPEEKRFRDSERNAVNKHINPNVQDTQRFTQPGDEAGDLLIGRNFKRLIPTVPESPLRQPVGNTIRTSATTNGGFGGDWIPPQMSNAKPQINIEMALKQIDLLATRIIGLSKIVPAITINLVAAHTGLSKLILRVDSLAKLAPAITLNLVAAHTGLSKLILRIDSLTKLAPAPTLNTKPANNVLTALIKRIDSIANMKPAPQLNTKPANSTLSALIKRIDSISNLHPSFKLDTKAANSALSSLINRIDSINNMHPTVHVGISGPGASVASKGDTSSKFDLGSAVSSKANSGDTIVNLNISGNEIVNEQRITRRVKRSMGSDRFVYGV